MATVTAGNLLKTVADAVGLGDDAFVDKVLGVADGLFLAEVVEKGVAGGKEDKTVSGLGRVGASIHRRLMMNG